MEILTIEQVAEMLNVKPGWIYARTADGALRGTGRGRKRQKGRQGLPRRATKRLEPPIPHYKAGRLLRFDKAEVLVWWAEFHRGEAEPSGGQPEGAPEAAENVAVN